MTRQSTEFQNFDRTMRELMKVPHGEIKANKQKKKRKAKPSASDRASGDEG